MKTDVIPLYKGITSAFLQCPVYEKYFIVPIVYDNHQYQCTDSHVDR